MWVGRFLYWLIGLISPICLIIFFSIARLSIAGLRIPTTPHQPLDDPSTRGQKRTNTLSRTSQTTITSLTSHPSAILTNAMPVSGSVPSCIVSGGKNGAGFSVSGDTARVLRVLSPPKSERPVFLATPDIILKKLAHCFVAPRKSITFVAQNKNS